MKNKETSKRKDSENLIADLKDYKATQDLNSLLEKYESSESENTSLSDGDKTWQKFDNGEINLFENPNDQEQQEQQLEQQEQQGEEDHINAIDLPEAPIEDVFADPRGPGFEQDRQKKKCTLFKLLLIIFIVVVITAGITLFIMANLVQGKPQTVDKSERQKSQSELVVVDQKKQIQDPEKYKAQNELKANNSVSTTTSAGSSNSKNMESALAVEQKEPFLKRIFRYFSRIKRKKLLAVLVMFTLLAFAFFQQKYSPAFSGTHINGLANTITEARTLNQPFHNWFASAPNVKTNDKLSMTKNEPFRKYFTSQVSCDYTLPNIKSQSLVLKHTYKGWGADHWNTRGKNARRAPTNIQQKKVFKGNMWFTFLGFFIMWLFFDSIFFEGYIWYVCASLLVQYSASYMFHFDFYFDIFATYMFGRLVKDNYDNITKHYPRYFRNKIWRTLWVMNKIVGALELLLVHKEFFMFQYFAFTGTQFTVDRSNLKAYDFMKDSVRPRQIFYGNLWVAYWGYILVSTHLSALVIGAILWAVFRPR